MMPGDDGARFVYPAVMTEHTAPFQYRIDDWLVIRTDANGHQACIVTECWPEWGRVGTDAEERISPEYFASRKYAVLKRALLLSEPEWLAMSCDTGWCGKCEGWT